MPYLLVALLLIVPTHALAHKAHQHGVAQLAVAVDGEALQIVFDSPLYNIVGFERPPRNARQEQALAAADQLLHQVERLFALPAAAGCRVEKTEISWPWPLTVAGQQGQPAPQHSDLLAVYELQCANPQALTAIDVRLFEAFSRLRTLRTEVAGEKGQQSVTLDRKRTILRP